MRPTILNPIFADITVLPGIGPKLAALISKVAGSRIVDILLTPPIAVIDRSARPKIADAPFGALATIEVSVDKHDPTPKGTRRPYKVICSDDTGFLTLVFFHARADYLQKVLPEGKIRIVSGKIEEFNGSRQMTHPDYIVEPGDPASLPEFEPVYPLTTGLSSNVMRKAAVGALQRCPELTEWQDLHWLKRQLWSDWRDAVNHLHTPSSDSEISAFNPNRMRLAYDELLANQLAILLTRRARVRSTGRSFSGDKSLVTKANAALPFKLTDDQKSVLREVFNDMKSPDRMVRLVQGDVGSGKTIVAFFAMLNVIETGAQAALMAPTEILARQHLESLAPLCEASGVSMEILTGRSKAGERRDKLSRLAAGEVNILVGTHALFTDDVAFHDLGLVVIDEQHRFGVHQRMALTEKGPKPDLLVMTATPIPRTLALTAYGDMDVSQIKEKPPGRKPVDTRAMPLSRIDEVLAGVKRAIENGEQIYWVCPLVEESELIDLTAVEERFESLKDIVGERAGIVHGRMKSTEKDEIMSRFHRGDISVLIATTVIEVGVNAPNATIMIIEHAERFGLAQLHQLRGRVGRGEKASRCILLYKAPLGETATARIKILRESEDGFLIAEEDMRLRGAGDMLGAAQSGFPRFRIADLAVHGELLSAARGDAKLIVETDPDLKSERGRALRTLLYLFSRDDAVKLLRSG